MGWGWPWAGPQDTVWMECWAGPSLSLGAVGMSILEPGPMGPQLPCGRQSLPAGSDESEGEGGGGPCARDHLGAPHLRRPRWANAPASLLSCLFPGDARQMALTRNQESWIGPGLGKAFPLQPGRLKKVQGIGWYLDEKNLAQVSTNLLDFEVTALHTVYEETCREAQVSRVAPPPSLPLPGCPQAPSRGLTLLDLCRS